MIEILTVVGIISLLTASIIVMASGVPDKARKTGTQGTLNQLAMALQRYYSEFKLFPPDGYDTNVTAPNGKQLKGSACLTYYLAWMYPDGSGDFISFDMQKTDFTDPEHLRQIPVHNRQPFWVGFKKKEDLDSNGEVLDKWGNPLRYDNCDKLKDGTNQYSPNCQPMGSASDPDPRVATNNGQAFNAGGYDLWSCGRDGDTEETDAEDDIISGREEAK